MMNHICKNHLDQADELRLWGYNLSILIDQWHQLQIAASEGRAHVTYNRRNMRRLERQQLKEQIAKNLVENNETM